MIDLSYLKELDRFNLIIRKRVTSNYSGPRKSLAFGRGMVFKDHRIYAPGDDFRGIDWKVFARTDHLYIKNYEEERNLTVHVIVDCSKSMDFGKGISKFEYASMLGVGFAYLAMKQNERFVFSTFSDQIDVFQPRRGMSQLATMVFYLNNLKLRGQSKIKEMMSDYRKTIKSRSLVFLISDYLINLEDIREALYALGHNEVKAIQILDPVEKNLKFEGDFKLKDSETNQMMELNINPRLRSTYQDLLNDHSSKISEICSQLGVPFTSLTTDTSIYEAFFKILG